MSSEATQFRPGQSGNPGGRPKGARNKITVAIEALIDAASTDIATKAIELAKAGDATMIRALLDRAAPPRRDRHTSADGKGGRCGEGGSGNRPGGGGWRVDAERGQRAFGLRGELREGA